MTDDATLHVVDLCSARSKRRGRCIPGLSRDCPLVRISHLLRAPPFQVVPGCGWRPLPGHDHTLPDRAREV